MAYNFKSGATGQYQITETALKDYNKHARENELTELNLSDMYEPKYAYMVSNWYLNEHIPDLLWDYGIPDTITSRLIAYNYGIGNLSKWFKHGCHWNKLPLETRNYVIKYFKELKGDD
jgi:soluble lytic murein transglycosylase-like protein